MILTKTGVGRCRACSSPGWKIGIRAVEMQATKIIDKDLFLNTIADK
jgi:hypothetical protein